MIRGYLRKRANENKLFQISKFPKRYFVINFDSKQILIYQSEQDFKSKKCTDFKVYSFGEIIRVHSSHQVSESVASTGTGTATASASAGADNSYELESPYVFQGKPVKKQNHFSSGRKSSVLDQVASKNFSVPLQIELAEREFQLFTTTEQECLMWVAGFKFAFELACFEEVAKANALHK